MKKYLAIVLICWLSLAGCTALKSQRLSGIDQRPTDCNQLLNQLDKIAHKYGVGQAGLFRVYRFPYLRINRFLLVKLHQAESTAKKNFILNRLHALDLQARNNEIQNLPPKALDELNQLTGNVWQRDMLYARTESCALQLFDSDRRYPDFFQSVKSSVMPTDEYSTIMRVVGLYPLTAIPVNIITYKVRNEFNAWFAIPLKELPVDGQLIAFGPRIAPRLGPSQVAELIASASHNPLAIPVMTDAQKAELARQYAPVYYQDVFASYDRIGRVIWHSDGIDIDTSQPTVYYYFTLALHNDVTVLQINYVIWYSGRRGPNPPAIERGHLDGLTIRISLNQNGIPVMVDAINNCGCYHLFAPPQNSIRRQLPQPFKNDAFVPQYLPPSFPKQRLHIRINSGWHQIQRLFTQELAAASKDYDLLPYDQLESLPYRDGHNLSMFNQYGIVKGSARIEPILLFPMGIPNVGSMRQRGHHAIELVGRSHFDDPALFNRHFEFKKGY